MPNPFEFPGMLRAVVPLVGRERFSAARRNVVDEFVALALGHASRPRFLAFWRSRLKPGFAAVIGPLNDLAKPAAGLGGVDAIRIHTRSLDVVDLPARE